MSLVRVVGGFVENEDKQVLFVQQREPYGIWKIPTGRIEHGEEPMEAFIREVKEETGYSIDVLAQIGHEFYEGRRGDRMERINFYAVLTGGEPSMQQDEIIDMRWVERDFLWNLMESYPSDHPYHQHMLQYFEHITRPGFMR